MAISLEPETRHSDSEKAATTANNVSIGQELAERFMAGLLNAGRSYDSLLNKMSVIAQRTLTQGLQNHPRLERAILVSMRGIPDSDRTGVESRIWQLDYKIKGKPTPGNSLRP